MSDQNRTPMTKEAAARIQSSEAKANDGQTPKGGFSPRAQAAADRNTPKEEGGKK